MGLPAARNATRLSSAWSLLWRAHAFMGVTFLSARKEK
jgi:hypothetical protein